MSKKPTLLEALEVLVESVSANATSDVARENFVGTAERLARMYSEVSWTPTTIAEAVCKELNKVFPSDSQSAEGAMVVQGPILLNSYCPHHFQPVRYQAYIGYLPKNGQVLGLSKIARIPEALSRQFVLQEQLAEDIAHVFYEPEQLPYIASHLNENSFSSQGSIVQLVGVHTCEACRGVMQDARTSVTARRGLFTDDSLEARFYQQVDQCQKARPFGG